MKMRTWVTFVLALIGATSSWSACPVYVPGTASLYLAGMPDGTLASEGSGDPPDVAPDQSPTLVPNVVLAPGTSLTFSAVGFVAHCPLGSFCFSRSGPDGAGGSITTHSRGPEHGISDILAPFDALVGVFLDSDRPDASSAPAMLEFATLESLDYVTISPQLKQVFFIGDGRTSLGVTQHVVVPVGAARLFLGTVDSWGWAGNYGSFSVIVSPSTNCQSGLIRVSEIELCWPSESNALYRVEYQSSLTTNTWLPLFTNVVGTGDVTCIYDKVPRERPQRLYRVVNQ